MPQVMIPHGRQPCQLQQLAEAATDMEPRKRTTYLIREYQRSPVSPSSQISLSLGCSLGNVRMGYKSRDLADLPPLSETLLPEEG